MNDVAALSLRFAGATVAGIVIGAKLPLMLAWRSDPPAARLISAAIAVLLRQRWDGDDLSVFHKPATGVEP